MDINPQNVTELLKAMSWQKILQSFVFITVLIISWTVWENRSIIYNTIRVGVTVESSDPLIIEISKGTQEYIASATRSNNDPIIGIQVVSVDFKKNTRLTSYFHIKNKVLRDDYETHLSTKIVDTPLFNNSEVDNQRLINLINGDFICSDFSSTAAAKLFPNTAGVVTTICGVSIPPYYGRFSGYMNIYLNRPIDSADIIYIKQLSRDISLRIYEFDINPNITKVSQ